VRKWTETVEDRLSLVPPASGRNRPNSAIWRRANRSRKQTLNGAQFKFFGMKRLCKNKAHCALPPPPVRRARLEVRAI
jgi:hypothetical protein